MTLYRHARRLLPSLLVPALLVACSQSSIPEAVETQATAYVAQDLGTLGGPESYTWGVSEDGKTAVGVSSTGLIDGYSRQHAFLWTEAGGMKDLGALDIINGGSWAKAVSDGGGTVVGATFVPGGAVHPFIWTEAGGMRDLGTLGTLDGWSGGAGAEDVSADGGTVVGTSELVGLDEQHAFVWTEAGGMKDLGTLGGPHSYAEGVSGDGKVVVGYSHTPDRRPNHGFVWTEAGGMRSLGTLGGSFSEAFAVSADGQRVVGSSTTAGNQEQHAFLWTPTGGMRDLGTLGGRALGENISGASGISADGQTVVGYSSVAGEEGGCPFVWTEALGMQCLDASSGLSPQVRTGGLQSSSAADGPSSAEAVADGGRVVVGSYSVNGGEQQRAVRWTLLSAPTPVPVKSTYLIDFERAPANTLLYSVKLGSGVVHRGGGTPSSATVPVVGKRRVNNTVLSAHLAKVVSVYGSKRLVVSSPTTNAPAPQGGRVKLSFSNFDPKGVALTSLTLSNLTTKGAYLTFYYANGTLSRQTLGMTKAGGSLVVPLNLSGLQAVDVYAPSAFAVDNVAFTVTK